MTTVAALIVPVRLGWYVVVPLVSLCSVVNSFYYFYFRFEKICMPQVTPWVIPHHFHLICVTPDGPGWPSGCKFLAVCLSGGFGTCNTLMVPCWRLACGVVCVNVYHLVALKYPAPR